jgi:AraC-like DNA-binding protein
MASGGSAGLRVTQSQDAGMFREMAERPAHPGLDEYVGLLCGYEERPDVPMRRREVPHGRITIILSFGDKIELVENAGSPPPGMMTSFVAGLHDGHTIVESGRQHGIQLDLTPLGAYRLLGLPMDEIAGQVVPLDDVRGRAIDELVERLATAPGWSERFDLVDRTLLGWAEDGPQPDPEVRWAWNQLARNHGQIAVGPLAVETGWSHRHFVTRFRRQVGLAPKPTGRILRFRRAVRLLVEAGPDTTITDVAVSSGYADHSHFTREFQSLAGCTPSAYLSTQLPAGGFEG